MKKKILPLLLTFLLAFGMLPATTFANEDGQAHDFADMPNNWSTAALKKAVENELLKGYTVSGKKLINANAPLKRAEMAAVVNRAFGAVKTAELNGVTDVASKAWYASDMAKAVMMGTFMKDTKMRPESNITRQEAFVVLARAFKVSSDTAENKALANYSDQNRIAAWAKKDINAMLEAGYVQGSDGKLNPNANISRAEFATVMDNLVKQYIDIPGDVTDISTSGNVLIRVPGVTLKDLTIKGDLIIADGVGEGDVTLDNVKVEGRTVVRGGGENSVIIKGNSDLSKVIVCKVDGKVRISVEGEADVEVIYVDDGSDDVLIKGNIGTLEVAGDNITAFATDANLTKAVVSGDYSAIILRDKSNMKEGNITGNASKIIVENGTAADKITISGSDAKVEGDGTVKDVEVKADGDNASVTTPNTKIEAAKGAEGVTAAGGAPVGSGTSATNNNTGTWIVTPPRSGGGGGAPAPSVVAAINISTDVDVTGGVDNDAVVMVTLTTANSDAGIYYTTDGSTPTDSSTKYTAPFAVDTDNIEGETVTIKAIGIKTGYTNSAVAEKGIVFKPVPSEFAGGDGTEENPYQVATVEQLDNVRNHLDKHFIQTEDIDLAEYLAEDGAGYNAGAGWLPIGNSASFTGSYNGNNKTIRHLIVERYGYYTALFGQNAGTIENVSLLEVDIEGEIYVAGLIGLNNGGTVTNCSVTGSIESTRSDNDSFAGGLIGYDEGGQISECHSSATVNAPRGGETLGGLIGWSAGSSITNCYATGSVTGGDFNIGGLIGKSNGSSITYCYATGAVTGSDFNIGGLIGWSDNSSITNCFATGAVTGDENVGGLIGNNYDSNEIANSYATGEVEGTGNNVGGLVGSNSGTVDNCYSQSTVTSSGNNTGGLIGTNGDTGTVNDCFSSSTVTSSGNNAGGLIGWNSKTVENCFTTGEVIGTGIAAGGLVGYNNNNATVENCYSIASVNAAIRGGGLVGSNIGSVVNCFAAGNVEGSGGGLIGWNGIYPGYGTVTNSYWDNQSSGRTSSDGGTGKTTSDMILQGTFAGWDFENVWQINADPASYPYLQWQGNENIPYPDNE